MDTLYSQEHTLELESQTVQGAKQENHHRKHKVYLKMHMWSLIKNQSNSL